MTPPPTPLVPPLHESRRGPPWSACVGRSGLLALLAVFGVLPPSAGAHAQDREPGRAAGWNSPRVLELVDRAREARRRLVADGSLESYRALTEGHIYFFVDPEEGERALIRVDQVAVELRWRAPDRFEQHIVGERSETRLPVREFRYYLDRLTLVQYGFGDEIQVGSGMDVSGVPHPLAPDPGTERPDPYDFRLADSLSLQLPGRADPVRLYELEIRPRRSDAPGILGTIVLDRATASIVRMAFTFTPASYVDPRTDRISVELDYGLWEERYWLPNRQRIEVRRELPELDLGVGTVIRAVLRVGDYELNVPLEEMPVLGGSRVTQAPPHVREAYPFPEGLYDGLERHGLSDVVLEVDPRELRRRAMELVRDRPLSGLSPLRAHLPRVSELVRYNRAEGLFLGAGASWRPRDDLRLRAHGGYAFGEGRARGSLRMEGFPGGPWTWWALAEAETIRDLGLAPGSDPLVSTLGAVLRAEDYLDPWRVSGISVGAERPLGGSHAVEVRVGWERQRPMARVETTAPLDGGRSFRPVRAVGADDFLRAGLGVRSGAVGWPAGGTGALRFDADLVHGESGRGVALAGDGAVRWGPPSRRWDLRLELRGWSWLGDPLPRGHRLLGGRETLPGFPYRAFAGRYAAAAALGLSRDVATPHLRARGGLHAGWAGGGDPQLLGAWNAAGTGTVRVSARAGVGILWDLVRIEAARGVGGGEWQLLISVDPRWWDWL